MQAEKLTKLFQAIGAALALPAAAAGVFTVYKTNFSPDVACQNLRASIVSTMEKNVALEAKKALLKKEVAEFDKACGDLDPAARAMFQAVLEGKANPGDQSHAATPTARPVAVASSGSPNAASAAPPPVPPVSSPVATSSPPSGAQTPSSLSPPSLSPPSPSRPSLPPASSAVVSPPPSGNVPAASPMPASSTMQMAPAERPAAVAPPPAAPQALPPATARTLPAAQPPVVQGAPSAPQQGQLLPPQGQGQKSAGTKMAAKPVAAAAASPDIRGWVVLARRDGPRRAEINFEGFAFSPTAFPPPGTVLTAKATLPVLASAGGSAGPAGLGGPGRPPEPQNVLRPGSCVKVLATRVGAGRLWGEVVSVRC